jgi:hypothetical protein
MRAQCHVSGTVAAVLILCASLTAESLASSTSVKLSVDASEAFGNPLVYQWRATDGNIVDPDAVSTDWILPNGPGIHFAYVLVSNGKGGFAEDRIAVNTDGNPTTTMLPRDEYPPAQQLAPVPSPDPSPDAPQIKGTMRLEFGADCGTRSPFFDVYVTAQVILFDNMFRVLNAATLNPYADGQFALYNPGNGAFLLAICDGAIDFFTLGSNNPLNIFTIHGTTRPEVRSMSAKLNGANVGIYLWALYFSSCRLTIWQGAKLVFSWPALLRDSWHSKVWTLERAPANIIRPWPRSRTAMMLVITLGEH